jgi:hypothetical protein
MVAGKETITDGKPGQDGKRKAAEEILDGNGQFT